MLANGECKYLLHGSLVSVGVAGNEEGAGAHAAGPATGVDPVALHAGDQLQRRAGNGLWVHKKALLFKDRRYKRNK